MKTQDLDILIQDILDGRSDDSALVSLEKELETNDEARVIYLDYIYLELALEFTEEETNYSEILPMDVIISRQKLRTAKIAGLCAAALLLIGAIITSFLAIPEAPIANFEVTDDTRFQLTHTPSEDGTLPQGQVLELGSRLEVQTGTVELNFGSGVRGIVRAPADLTLISENRVDLAFGVVWFSVEESEAGFQVNTPDFLLTDLGTEFGVISELEGMDEAHVFKGKVEVHNHHNLSHKQEITQNHALQAIAEGPWEEIACRPERFLKQLPQNDLPPYIRLRFDSEDQGALAVEGTHWDVDTIVAQFHHDEPFLESGVDQQAARFNGKGDFIQTNWPGISGKRTRSFACWIQVPPSLSHSHRSAIVGWGNPKGNTNGKWKVLLSNISEEAPARISFGTEWFDGETPLNDGVWHHLAVVYHGRDLDNGFPVVVMYVDGRKEELSYLAGTQNRGVMNEIDTDTASDEALPMMIGDGLLMNKKTFQGKIDDLYIFEGVLSETQIRTFAHRQN